MACNQAAAHARILADALPASQLKLKVCAIQLGQPELAQNGTGENVPKKWVWGPETAAPEGGYCEKVRAGVSGRSGHIDVCAISQPEPPHGPPGELRGNCICGLVLALSLPSLALTGPRESCIA